MSEDYHHRMDAVEIKKVTGCDGSRAIRVYKADPTTWIFQVRGPMTLGSGKQGKDYVIAGARLCRADMLYLHRAITDLLYVAP